MNVSEQALTLQTMAAKDLKAMRALIDPESADDEVFGFHAQQAVEKSLKAWIAFAGGTFGHSHDLQRLLLELEQLGCAVGQFENLVEMTPFAVQFRYEAFEPGEPDLDRADVLARVKALFDHVQAIVTPASPT